MSSGRARVFGRIDSRYNCSMTTVGFVSPSRTVGVGVWIALLVSCSPASMADQPDATGSGDTNSGHACNASTSRPMSMQFGATPYLLEPFGIASDTDGDIVVTGCFTGAMAAR